jgi:hypothetical protein
MVVLPPSIVAQVYFFGSTCAHLWQQLRPSMASTPTSTRRHYACHWQHVAPLFAAPQGATPSLQQEVGRERRQPRVGGGVELGMGRTRTRHCTGMRWGNGEEELDTAGESRLGATAVRLLQPTEVIEGRWSHARVGRRWGRRWSTNENIRAYLACAQKSLGTLKMTFLGAWEVEIGAPTGMVKRSSARYDFSKILPQ